MDIVDFAEEHISQEMANAEAAIRQRVASGKRRLTPRGYCYNPVCEAVFPEGSPKLFCGPSCAETHETFRKQNGRI